MLDLYRRHSEECPHRQKGGGWTKCSCPIWCYGELNGRPIRKSLKLRDWARAMRRAESWESAPSKAVAIRTIDGAIKSYIDDCGSRGLAASTIESYRKTLDHLRDFRGDVGMDEIDLEFLTDFRSGRKVKPSTAGKELETLRAFGAFCVARKWMPENYAKALKSPLDERPPTLPFAPAEVIKIIAACDSIASGNPSQVAYVRSRARAEMMMLLYSGLRISDVVKLERSTVDLQSGRMMMRVMKTGVQQYMRLHPSAVAALAALPNRGPYFFWSGRGKLTTAIKNARRTVQRLLAIAGVDGHPHRFRDTFSVALLDQGEDLRTVQLLLGHASIKTTERHYAPFVKSFQRILDAATSKLDFEPTSRTESCTVESESAKLFKVR